MAGLLSDPTLPGPQDLSALWTAVKGLLSPPDPYGDAGKAVEQYRSGKPLGAFATMYGAMPATGALKASPGIIAYHGSPHSFDRFDLSKIGTGEGAQAYGHGLYFADNEDVAKSYRNALTDSADMLIGGKERDFSSPEHVAAWKLHDYQGDRGKAYLDIYNNLQNYKGSMHPRHQDAYEEALGLIRNSAPLPEVKPAGSMYQVRINADPEHFLDWDKPLSEQPPAIQDWYNQNYGPRLKTREIGNNPNLGPLTDVSLGGGSLGVFTQDRLPEVLSSPSKFVPTKGANLYESEQLVPGDYRNPVAASSKLKELGIPGIKYLDQGSRGAGDGSRNYVVFDDKLIDILKKYGLAGLLGGGAAMNAGSPAPNAQQGAPLL